MPAMKNTVMPSSAVLVQKQQAPTVRLNNNNMKSEDAQAYQITEQQVKELHLFYEQTLNRKKETMNDYESYRQVVTTKKNFNCCSMLRKCVASACCAVNKLIKLKYIKKYTVR